MKIVELGTKESKSTISELSREIPVILVGSTISSWARSSLFSGFDFTGKMFNFHLPISKIFCDSAPLEHLLERIGVVRSGPISLVLFKHQFVMPWASFRYASKEKIDKKGIWFICRINLGKKWLFDLL